MGFTNPFATIIRHRSLWFSAYSISTSRNVPYNQSFNAQIHASHWMPDLHIDISRSLVASDITPPMNAEWGHTEIAFDSTEDTVDRNYIYYGSQQHCHSFAPPDSNDGDDPQHRQLVAIHCLRRRIPMWRIV